MAFVLDSSVGLWLPDEVKPKQAQRLWSSMIDANENPYRPPGAVDDAPPAAVGTGAAIRIEDVRLRAGLTLSGMALTGLLGLALIAGTMLAPDWFTLRQTESRLAPMEICAALHLTCTTGYFILFLFWIHRSAHNARLLDGPRSDLSPGLAAGSFFIPVYNLVGPALAMGKAAAVIQRFSHGPAAWVGVWWAAWLLSSVASWIARVSESTLSSLFVVIGGQGISLMFSAALVIRLTLQQTWLVRHPPQIAVRKAMVSLRTGTSPRPGTATLPVQQAEPKATAPLHPAAPRPRMPQPGPGVKS